MRLAIKAGQWCPRCAGVMKGTIETMRRLAESRGGKCLSEEYTNNRTHLEWQCKEGHRWRAISNSIRQGTWCLLCNNKGKRCTMEEVRGLAASRKGRCLSNRYVNDRARLRWQCDKGLVWKAAPHDVKRGTWCPVCAQSKRVKWRQVH